METENLQRELKKKCLNLKNDEFVTFLKVLGNFVITIVRGYMYTYITFMNVLWHICCSKGACVTQGSYEPHNSWPLKTAIVKSSDKSSYTREVNGNPLQYSFCEKP